MCLAIPGEILDINDGGLLMRTGRVSFGGLVKEINLSLVPEARVGNFVIVHAGFAISVVDDDQARKVFEYIDEIDNMAESEKE